MNKYLLLLTMIALPNLGFSRYIRGEATFTPTTFVKVQREICKKNNITGYECKNPNAPEADRVYVIHYISKRR